MPQSIARRGKLPTMPVFKPEAARPASFQLHRGALGTVQQPLEVEAGKRVIGMEPDERSKRGHRQSVARLQFGECLEVLRGRRCQEGRSLQGLEGAQRLAATAQHEIADRSSLEARACFSNTGADANASPQKLVGGFE